MKVISKGYDPNLGSEYYGLVIARGKSSPKHSVPLDPERKPLPGQTAQEMQDEEISRYLKAQEELRQQSSAAPSVPKSYQPREERMHPGYPDEAAG